MKTIILLLVLMARLSATDYEMIIVAGQSNAQGWKGDGWCYPKDKTGVDATIPLYYVSPGIGSSSGKWVTLGPQQGLFKHGHFGPEISMARELAATGRHPAIFKYTLGGSQLERKWKRPGEGGLYDQMCRELKLAQKAYQKQGHRLKIVGFVWIQGESDALEPGPASRYEENLSLLISHFRNEVAANPTLPFILGVDEQHKFVVARPIVMIAQQRIAGADPMIRYTSMMGLRKADKSHLTPCSLVTHGQRLSEAFLALDP